MSGPLTARIGRTSQAAGIRVDAGSGLWFHLDERWMSARPCDRVLEVRATGAAPPVDLEAVLIRANHSSGVLEQNLAPAANLVWTHPWDGLQSDGTRAIGSVAIPVELGWVRQPSGQLPARTEWWNRTAVAGAWDARALGFGGLVPTGMCHLEVEAGVLWTGAGNRAGSIDMTSARRRSTHGLSWVPARDSDVVVVAGGMVHVFVGDGRHLSTFHRSSRREVFRLHYTAEEHIAGWTVDGRHTYPVTRGQQGVAVSSPGGQQVTFDVGDDWRVRSLTDAGGARFEFSFDASGLLATATDPAGLSLRCDHDAHGRAIGLIWSAGRRQDVLVDETPDRRTVRMLTAAGREAGETRRSLPGETTEIRSRCCGAGAETVTTRSPGRTVTVRPDGTRVERIESSQTDSHGVRREERVTLATPAGRRSIIVHRHHIDGDGVVTEVRERSGATWTRRHDPTTGITTETTPTGKTTWADVSQPGLRRWGVSGGGVIEQDFDNGRLVRIRQGGSSRTINYDDHGRVASVDDDGQYRWFDYDTTGRLVGEHSGTGWLRYRRDAAGRVVATTTPNGDTTTFELTTDGLPVSRTRPTAEGPVVERFDHDDDGLLVSSRTEGEQPQHFDRDAAGRIVAHRAGDDRIDIGWDETTGRVARIATAGGDSVSFAHDGHLLVAERSNGRVTGEVLTDYDEAFRPRTLHVAGMIARIERNAEGRVLAHGPVRFDRAQESGKVANVRAGQLSTRSVHDDDGALVSAVTKFSDQTVFAETITRDNRGRIVAVEERTADTTTVVEYRYDDHGRLIQALRDGSETLALAYDANDNAVTSRRPDGEVQTVVGAGDRPRTHAGKPVTVSPAGRILRLDDRAFTYDGYGRVVGVDHDDGRRVGYVRDGRHQLIEVAANGQVAWQLLRTGTGVAAVLYPDGRVWRTVPGITGPAPAALFDSNRVLRLVTDHRGSVRRVVDVFTGEVVQALEYDPLGMVIEDTSPGFQPFGYAGGVHDPVGGLVHLGGRELDVSTSRFLQPDPLDLAGGQTNLYVYAANDPVNRHDPGGHQSSPSGSVEVCKVKVGSADRSTNTSSDHGYLKWGRNGDGSQSSETVRRGMGEVDGGHTGYIPGFDIPLPEVEWQDEDKVDKKEQNEECREVEDVDIECLEGYTAPGTPLGQYNTNNLCWDSVWDALDACSDSNWKWGDRRDGDPVMPLPRVHSTGSGIKRRLKEFLAGWWWN